MRIYEDLTMSEVTPLPKGHLLIVQQRVCPGCGREFKEGDAVVYPKDGYISHALCVDLVGV